MSENWHNGTVQGQRNTVAAQKMRKRAAAEMSKWLNREYKEPKRMGRKLRGRRRRLIAHEGAL